MFSGALRFTLPMYSPSDDGGTVQITRGRKRRDVPPFYATGLDATIVPEALAINILIPLRFYVFRGSLIYAFDVHPQ